MREFREAWRVTFPALIFCTSLDFVGGTFLGKYFDKLMVDYPILLLVLPGLMGLRGNIYGALASRFTTSLFLGEIRPSLKERRVFEGLVLGIYLSLLPILFLWIVGLFKIGRDALNVLAILVSSTIFVSILLGYATAVVSIIPFRRGIDPDAIASPLVTSISDILTIPMLIAFVILFEIRGEIFYMVMTLLISLSIFLLFRFKINKRTFLELSTILILFAMVEGLSGSIFESYSEFVYKAFIFSVLYPSILDSLGNYGCVVGSKTSTRLHLGEVKTFFDLKSVEDILSLLSTSPLLSLFMYSLGYIVSVKLNRIAEVHYEFFLLYPIFVLLVMILSYSLAFLSYKMGLDPDNVTIPAITTLADLIGTIFTVVVVL